jgi:hypothetical protein
MDPLDESTSFLKHVFKFDKDSKGDMMNIVQYAVLALTPVLVLNKLMYKYIPDADEDKSSIEILVEIVGQMIILFIGQLIIHRIITYVPTYSGLNYPDHNIITNILAMLIITLSLQTKLGDKASILSTRIMDAWNGTESFKNVENKRQGQGEEQGQQHQQLANPIPPRQMALSDGTTMIQDLPSSQPLQAHQPVQNIQQHQQTQNEPVAMSEYAGYENFSAW